MKLRGRLYEGQVIQRSQVRSGNILNIFLANSIAAFAYFQ